MTGHKINTASLELCKELYELSEWRNTELYWYQDWLMQTRDHQNSWQIGHLGQADETTFPAYDLGYLLRKLPSFFFPYKGKSGNRWYIGELIGSPTVPIAQIFDETESDTPEDAACKLVIALFKQGGSP